MCAKKKNINIEEPFICPIYKCNQKLDNEEHKCSVIPSGVYLGNGVTLGNNIIYKNPKGAYKGLYGQSFENHPFYYKVKGSSASDRNGIEAHHLVSSSSVLQEQNYMKLVKMLGYNINHRNNGVLLPTYMGTACAFAVPLHNGGHGATFIYEKYDDKESETIENWKFQPVKKLDVKAVFSAYSYVQELATLTYEKHVNNIVKKKCESFLIDELCDGEKRLEKATEFIQEMDDLSQVIFKKISTFKWTITSDGIDYAPGNIGCCMENTLERKREEVKKALQDVKLPSAKKHPKAFWEKVHSKDLYQRIKSCGAGSPLLKEDEKHYKNKNGIMPHYQERKNIEKFNGFKTK